MNEILRHLSHDVVSELQKAATSQTAEESVQAIVEEAIRDQLQGIESKLQLGVHRNGVDIVTQLSPGGRPNELKVTALMKGRSDNIPWVLAPGRFRGSFDVAQSAFAELQFQAGKHSMNVIARQQR